MLAPLGPDYLGAQPRHVANWVPNYGSDGDVVEGTIGNPRNAPRKNHHYVRT